MSILQAFLFDWAFGHLKQSDIFTGLNPASLTRRLPYAEFTPAMTEKDFRSDAAYFGKGHPYATYSIAVTQQEVFARTFDASSESLAWALSLLMGDVNTSGPVGNIYTHDIQFVSPVSQKECLYTSIIEKAGGEYQDLLTGAWLESVTLTANKTDLVRLALTARARKRTTDATSMPNVTPSCFFQTNYATFIFGEKGASTSVSEYVQAWNLTLNQNPDVRYAPGQTSGEEKLVRYALIGRQSISGSISLFISAAHRSLFVNDQMCELQINCKGISDVAHTMTIKIPKFKIQSEALAQDGETTVATFNFNEDTVLKDDTISDSPIIITLENEITALIQ